MYYYPNQVKQRELCIVAGSRFWTQSLPVYLFQILGNEKNGNMFWKKMILGGDEKFHFVHSFWRKKMNLFFPKKSGENEIFIIFFFKTIWKMKMLIFFLQKRWKNENISFFFAEKNEKMKNMIFFLQKWKMLKTKMKIFLFFAKKKWKKTLVTAQSMCTGLGTASRYGQSPSFVAAMVEVRNLSISRQNCTPRRTNCSN